MANTLSRGVQAQKLSVAVDEAKCVITEVIRVMNLEWLLPTYKHVTFISALHAVRKLQREQHIPSSSTIFIRFSKEGNFSDVRKKFENGPNDPTDITWVTYLSASLALGVRTLHWNIWSKVDIH